MQSASSDFVFNTDESLMWQTAANSFGVELSQIASFGGSALTNNNIIKIPF